MPGITYTEVNDVHYWKAEYTDEKKSSNPCLQILIDDPNHKGDHQE